MDWDEQYDKIYRYCFFRLRHQQTAEDLTQEVFLRFLENGNYCEHGCSLRYLYTIARNLCIDTYRKKQREAVTEGFFPEKLSDETPLTENLSYESNEDTILTGIVVRAAVKKLPEDEQELLLLRYVNEVPLSDICNILNMSRFSLYRRTSKALKHLREIIGEEGGFR